MANLANVACVYTFYLVKLLVQVTRMNPNNKQHISSLSFGNRSEDGELSECGLRLHALTGQNNPRSQNKHAK